MPGQSPAEISSRSAREPACSSWARAVGPCRVDLAGGTLDIWPLGRLFPGASTVSVAVDVWVEARVRTGGGSYRVRLGEEELEASAVVELSRSPRTALIGLVLSALQMPPCEIEVRSGSPLGAGLGASSTLTLALLAACRAAAGKRQLADRVGLARDLEAQLMELPTGVQDHITAEAGGAVVIEHTAGGPSTRALATPLEELSRRLLVIDSGQEHVSARRNWEVVRAALDGDRTVRAALAGIAAVAGEMVVALEATAWRSAGELMGREWSHRRQLGPGISTPAIERLLGLGLDAGAYGGKVCGAGGGGCIALLCPSSRRPTIAASLAAAGGSPLDASPTPVGLRVEGVATPGGNP